jgi:hypothetical protein
MPQKFSRYETNAYSYHTQDNKHMGDKSNQITVGDLVSPIRGNTTALGIVIRISSNNRFVAVRWFKDLKISKHCRVKDLILISPSPKP